RTHAGRACVLDHLPASLTGGTGPLQGEETLGLAHPPGAAACRACFRLCAGLRTSARAGFACHGNRDLDLRGLALVGFVESDLHVVAQVGPTLAPGAGALPGHAEQVLENVGEGGSEARAESRTAAAHAAMLERRMAETVIGRAFFAVLENLVGFV